MAFTRRTAKVNVLPSVLAVCAFYRFVFEDM